MAVKVSCDYCDSTLERYASEIEGKNNIFCNRECHTKYQKQRPPEEHASYKGGKVSVDCSNCGSEDVKEVDPYRVRKQDNFFCDQSCMGEFNAERYSGDGNPNFKGGDWDHNYRGKNGEPVRNKVRERDDYECQNCGATMEELGQVPDAHHIRPEHAFDNPEDAHFKENLILLCRDCHNNFDNLTVREQCERLERVENVMPEA